MVAVPFYTSLGWAVGILETFIVRQRREPLREERRAVRLLVLDPNMTRPEDWLIWQSIKAAQQAQQCH